MKKKYIFSLVFSFLVIFFLFFLVLRSKNTKITFNKNKDDFNTSNFYKNVYNNDSLVLINVWATWCNPCIEKMSFIESIKDTFKFVKVVNFSIDNDTVKLRNFLLKNKYNIEDITLKNINHRENILKIIRSEKFYVDIPNFNIKEIKVPYLAIMKQKNIIYSSNDSINKKELFNIIKRNE